MKKVCLLVPHSLLFKPYGRIYMQLLILQKHNFDITVVNLSSKRNPYYCKKESVNYININDEGLLKSPFVSILNPLTLMIVLYKSWRINADIYHCYDYSMLPIAFILKFIGKKVIYDIGDDNPSNMSYLLKKVTKNNLVAKTGEKIFRLLENSVCKKMDYIITLTDTLKKDRKKYNKKINSIYYCPVGFNNTKKQNIDLLKQYRKYNVIVYSGTISYEKGLGQILKAFKMLREKGFDDTILLMIGELSKNININKYIKDNNIVITGWVHYNEMPNYISTGNVGLALVNNISYSYKVSVPNKLLEQLACGLPVLAPKGFPEIQKIIYKSKAGYLVDMHKNEEIVEALIEILENQKLQKEMSANAFRYINENHSFKIAEYKLLKIYADI